MAADPCGPGRLLLLLCCLAAARTQMLDWSWLPDPGGLTAALGPGALGGDPEGPPADLTTPAPLKDSAPEQDRVLTTPEPAPETQDKTPAASPGRKDDSLALVGGKILHVAEGIRSFVQLWGDILPTPTPGRQEAPRPKPPEDTPTPPGPAGSPQKGLGLQPNPGGLSALDTPSSLSSSAGQPTPPSREPSRPPLGSPGSQSLLPSARSLPGAF